MLVALVTIVAGGGTTDPVPTGTETGGGTALPVPRGIETGGGTYVALVIGQVVTDVIGIVTVPGLVIGTVTVPIVIVVGVGQ